ncbi:TetR/AcrR family transcriptional regulator [Ancylobacter lacus]|uniref:TetR/AcrR family transcriptional regulator n=1 Tax=Ancylobacter lacus TaxID=2579970 RepID=UPI001BCFBA22|nr:TetR/AcrR family transcriptional regulator [Ancylobacter lacus]MBS7539367.1 TetR/AcrR family transcriptional regulator [Ancylobacter lacus]
MAPDGPEPPPESPVPPSGRCGERTTGLRPAHRRTGRGAATCAALRAAAAELFLERGYEGTSLDAVIARAGGSKTNVYGFFGGKEGLFLAVVEELCREIQLPLRALRLEAMPLRAGLAQLGATLLETLLVPRHLGIYRLVIGDPGRFPALGPLWYAEGPQATRAIVERLVRTRLAAGDPVAEALVGRGLCPEVFARQFHDLVVPDLLHRSLLQRGAAPPAPVRREVVEQALRALLGEEAGS